eukprot:765334-Hanusia_phi.AAC.1
MGFSEKERPHNDDDEKSAKANAPHGRRRSSVAGRRGSVSSRRGSTTSNEEESPKKGMLAAGKNMLASPSCQLTTTASSVGGQGLNTFTYEDDRFASKWGAGWLKLMRQIRWGEARSCYPKIERTGRMAVQQLGDLKEDFPDDPGDLMGDGMEENCELILVRVVFLPPTENSLSKYDILANRSKDLSMWCFREEVSQGLPRIPSDSFNMAF